VVELVLLVELVHRAEATSLVLLVELVHRAEVAGLVLLVVGLAVVELVLLVELVHRAEATSLVLLVELVHRAEATSLVLLVELVHHAEATGLVLLVVAEIPVAMGTGDQSPGWLATGNHGRQGEWCEAWRVSGMVTRWRTPRHGRMVSMVTSHQAARPGRRRGKWEQGEDGTGCECPPCSTALKRLPR
jgi:hypothetical protein